MPNLVEILVSAKNLTGPAFAEVKASGESMSGAMKAVNKTAALAATAMIGFLGESVNMASKFDSEMALLNTQAGVSQDKIAGLSKGVLDLAGRVGQNPDSLAESLFHVESNFESMGISSEKALHLTETAAKGAAVGHAKLVDVTNALTAAVASGIPGVQDFDQAMGVLNATVGVGDMTMQDLASAFGSGMVATVKGFGLTIADVGAGLATFGDNNIRGANAGTQLRMSVQALAHPVASAGDALKRLGLTSTTLSEDMQKGGLKLALEDLTARFAKAGITADQQGDVITQAFGRKAGAGLNVLLSQMDRVESKYPALTAGANNFGTSWANTQKTFAQQEKELQGSIDALMISLGEKLLPVLSTVVTTLLTHKQAVIEVAEVTAGLLTGLIAFSAVSKTITLIEGIGKAYAATTAAMTAYGARMVEVRAESELAGGSVTRLGAAFTALGTKAKIAVAASVIGLVALALIKVHEISVSAPPDIDRMTTSLGNLGQKGAVAGELAATFGSGLDKLGYAADRVAGKAAGMDKFNDTMNKFLTLGMFQSNSLTLAKGQIDALDQGLANLVQGGHADMAAAAVKKLQEAMAKQGKDPAELNAKLQKYGDALSAASLEQSLAAESMGALGQQAVDTSGKLADQAMTAKGLKEAIQDLNNANRSALDGMAGFEAAIDAASTAAKENGKGLGYVHGQMDLTTEKARTEEKALSDLAAKTDDAAAAALNNGESMDVVNGIYGRGRDKLVALAQQMGLTTQQARDLADQILATPDKTAQLKGDASDLQSKIADINKQLKTVPDSKRVDLIAEKNQMESDLAAIQNQIDGLHGKVVTVKVAYTTGANGDVYGHGGGYAHGGIIGAAGGGPRSGMTWVGEQGPELVRLPYGSTVYPAGQSQGMAAAAAGGGVSKLQIEWIGGQGGDEFMTWLRKNIRIQGGNVQTVLGRG